MRILIPEPLARNVLASTRSLARAGHNVTLAVPRRPGERASRLRQSSRFVEKTVNVQTPHMSPDGFVQDLLDLVVGRGFDVLLPFTHSTVVPISYRKDELSKYVSTPIVEYPVLRRAHDKLDTVRLAQRLGVPTPVTFHPKSQEDLLSFRGRLPFPCLVKARQGCGVGATIRFARSFDQLVEGYNTISQQPSTPPVNDYSLPIIQEYVPGQIHDAVFLYSRGRCRAALTQERVITYPVQGGPGAVNRTTHNPLLREMGQRLLDTLGWHGPAQVEFRLDPRDGKYKLLEINPKFWGTLPLALVAGIDFARMACELAHSGDVEPDFDYRVGVTYRWLFPSELYTLAQEPTLERLWQFFHFWKPNTYYDFDIRDPQPDLVRGVQSVRKVLFQRQELLPAKNELNELAMRRSPARQTEEG